MNSLPRDAGVQARSRTTHPPVLAAVPTDSPSRRAAATFLRGIELFFTYVFLVFLGLCLLRFWVLMWSVPQ